MPIDHINYTYSFDITREHPFQINFNPVTRELQSHKEEIELTAKHIANSVQGQIYLFFSGGIDSEIIATEFLNLGRDFTVISFDIFDGNGNNNSYDIWWAKKFCEKNNVKQILHPFNVEEFVKNNIPEYIDMGFYSKYIYRYMVIYMLQLAESLGGCAVLGGRESGIYLNEINEPCFANGVWFNLGSDYCLKYNKQHYPVFFLQNPEIFASYLKLPLIDTMLKDSNYFRNVPDNISLEKMIEYRKLYPDSPPRKKYYGFETMYKLWVDTLKKLTAQFPEESKIYLIPISKIKSQLGI
jgi:hypothetical protein